MLASPLNSLIVVFLISLIKLSAPTGIARSDRDRMFNDFLDMVEYQTNKKKERINKLYYTPNADESVDEQLVTDRHGQFYLKCIASNSQQGDGQTRCPLKHSKSRPGCHFTYDFKYNETIQGCYEDDGVSKDFCNDECKVEVKSYAAEGDNVKKYPVAFCCCRSSHCNAVSKKLLDAAYERYVSNQNRHTHHHKHHNNNKETMSFWDRFSSF